MEIKTIASSSQGCCYVIESNDFQLLIECGISLNKIREALNHDFSKVVGCLVSHEHKDHAGFLPKMEKLTNIPIWCTEGTKKRFDLKLCKCIDNIAVFSLREEFKVFPLKFIHDVECFGFLIIAGRESLFYATDTGKIKYNIPGLSYLMIEANHSFESLINSVRIKSDVARVADNHLGIDQVVDFVKLHPDLKEIHLIHLSDAHSDEELFKNIIAAASGVPVYISKK